MATNTLDTARAGHVNVGTRLSEIASLMPDDLAVVMTLPRKSDRRPYRTFTFAQLDKDSDVLASGLRRLGVTRGTRIALLVRPSIEFVSLTFALFKSGAVTILIDPGMGRKHMVRCLQDVEPEGFVAVPIAHVIRVLLRRRFPKARYNVTVGNRLFWGGPTIDELRADAGSVLPAAETTGSDPAAIIFTTGSTGPPKGVLYNHGNFNAQVDEIRDRFDIKPGGIDLSGFPLFGLFNGAMGTTTIIPDMDASRPASVDPRNIIEAVRDWNATQAFASPAVWNAVGRYCVDRDIRLPTLRRVLAAGAPVPPHVLSWMKQIIHPDGNMFTPYGATESLPVASISASEVLGETADRSSAGAGTCVGRRFSQIQWKVISISDDPIESIEQVEELPRGEIGELIVRGPVVTQRYVTRVQWNAASKITDRDAFWHRMGDVGYLDEQDRFWFCGRKSQRVITSDGTMFTIPCEAILNCHAKIYRSALVGIGTPGQQTPVMICEPWPDSWPQDDSSKSKLLAELAELAAANSRTASIRRQHILLHRSLPVDIRHNAKIFREKLSTWAEGKIV